MIQEKLTMVSSFHIYVQWLGGDFLTNFEKRNPNVEKCWKMYVAGGELVK